MNKKRVALALAAALGLNTLMVTVGQVGQQSVIAHAVDGKLVNPEDISRLNSIKIKTLQTQVNATSSTDVSLTFPELLGNIKNLIVKEGFKHAVFTERVGVDTVLTAGLNTTWDNDAEELKVTGMKAPGIYTGKVEIELADGSKETYTLSLRKTPSDSISFTTDVTTGMVEVKNLKFSNGVEEKTNLFSEADITLTNKRTGLTANAKLGTNSNDFKFSALDLDDKGKLQEGDVLELKVNYGAGVGNNKEYTLTSGIVLVKQAQPKITSVNATNSTGFAAAIGTQINNDFGVTGQDTGNSLMAGGKTILSYEQTKSGVNFGGALLTAVVNNLNVDLSINAPGQGVPNVDVANPNYVHPVYANYSKAGGANPSTTGSTGLIGDYTLTVKGKTLTYFDAMSGLKFTVDGDGKAATPFIVSVAGGLKDQITTDAANSKLSLDFNGIEHGYTSVVGVFDVNSDQDKNLLSQVNDEVNAKIAAANAPDNVGILGKLDTNSTVNGEVKVSLIVAADTLDGVGVQAKFNKISDSEGKLTLIGGASTLQNSTINVTGASVGTGSVSGQDLVFDVQFNGSVPSNINWELTPNGSNNKLAGVLDSGVIEAVNVKDVKATNEGAESLSKQFLIEANTDLSFPDGTEGKLTIDTNSSNRVTLDKFTEGAHNVNFVITKGKYQGTYTAGIDVEAQEIAVVLSSTDRATSNSITLALRGLEFVDGALDNVKDAWLEYRLAKDTVWIEDKREKIDLKKLASEQEFTVTKTGLKPSTLYDFRVGYQLVGDENIYYSNILEDEDTLAQGSNSGSGTITGSGGTTSGTSTGSTTITVTTSNSTTSGTSVGVNLPSGFRYDSGKSPVVTAIKYKGKDGKIVTETKEQFKNVIARFNGTKVELDELVSGKDYTEITVDYTDNNGKVRSIILKNVKTTSTVESDKYLANIYEVVFGRPADESGYHYHLKNLKNKNVSLRDFLLNMLSEKEFGEKYKTTESKIEALYSAIVNRTSDETGKKFWVDEYKKVLSVYGSESNALRAIADRMVNEGELKTLAEKMNLKW